MPDPRLIDYVRRNLHLGYTEEQLRKVLISAGYNVRVIEDALDTVLRPRELKPEEPPALTREESESFIHRIPSWMIIAGGAGFFLLIVIIIFLIPTDQSEPGLLSQNGLKVTGYDFSCAGPASAFTLTIKNEAGSAISDVKLFVDEVFQAEQLITALNNGETATYTYANADCNDWLGEKSIKIVSDKASLEGAIKFTCSSGAC